MKKHLCIFLLLIISISVNSQSINLKPDFQKDDYAETILSKGINLSQKSVLETLPVTNLTVDNTGFATWDAPEMILDLPLWMRYDNGINVQAIGVIGGGIIESAVKWDPIQLIGFEGTRVARLKFYIGDYPNASIIVRVYKGDNGEIIYEQALTDVNYGHWNYVILDTPVDIDVSQSLWVGFQSTHYNNEYPAGVGVRVDNPNSDLVKYNDGFWQHLYPSLNYSWNLAAYVEGEDGKVIQLPNANTPIQEDFDKSSSDVAEHLAISPAINNLKDPNYVNDEIQGYKVFLDGEFVGETLSLFWQFEDINGEESYTAGVIAKYDAGDSEIVEYEFDPFLPPTNLNVSNLGFAEWEMPAFNGKGIFLSEGFDSGIPENWEIENGGSTNDTWEWVADYEGTSFNETPFIMVNSDIAGEGNTMDEYITSPEIEVSSAYKLMISWDQNYQDLDTDDDYIALEVFDGAVWVEVFSQTEDDPPWGNFDEKSIDVTAYKNENFKFRFHYYAPGWDWYTLIDNVKVYEGAVDFFKLYLDGTFVGITQEMDWQFNGLVIDKTYTAGVSAYYNGTESEIIEESFTVTSDLVAPTDFVVNGNGLATWKAAQPNIGWMYYDNGEVAEGISGSGSFTWAIRFDPEQLSHYQNHVISKVKYFSIEGNAITIKIMQGVNAEDIIYTEVFDNNPDNAWKEVELSAAVAFDKTEYLWIGLYTDEWFHTSAAMGPNMGVPNGDWFLQGVNGADWEHLSDYDYMGTWNIRAYVEDDSGKTKQLVNNQQNNKVYEEPPITINGNEIDNITFTSKKISVDKSYKNISEPDNELLSYNLYLDNEFVETTTNLKLQYEGLVAGTTYTGGLAAIYNNGESEIVEYDFTFNSLLYLEVDPLNVVVGTSAGQSSFELSSNTNWVVSTDDLWLDVSVGSGEDDATIVVSYSGNNYGDRIGKIYVNAVGLKPVEITIFQEGLLNIKPPTNVEVSSYGFVSWQPPLDSEYDLLQYYIYLNNDFQTNLTETNYQLSGLVESQEYTVGVVAVYSEGNSIPAENDFIYVIGSDLSLYPGSYLVEPESGSVNFDIYSNTSWNVVSNDSWIIINPATGENNGSFTAHYLENYGSQRVGSVTISGDEVDDKVVNITQRWSSSEDARVFITPAHQDVDTSGVFTTNIEIDNIENIGSYNLEVLFNPSIVKVNSVTVDDFITSTGREISSIAEDINNVYGFIEYAVVTSGDGISGPNGSGVLLNIDWEVVGTLQYQTSTGLLLKDVVVQQTDGTDIPISTQDAALTIAPNFLNNFNIIDQIDIIPNPNNGIFKIIIKGLKTDMDLYIINSVGDVVRYQDIVMINSTSQSVNMDLSTMTKGVYFLKFVNKYQVYVMKVIVN